VTRAARSNGLLPTLAPALGAFQSPAALRHLLDSGPMQKREHVYTFQPVRSFGTPGTLPQAHGPAAD
jgi:hypothetical protein